jgi:hypothetical protein
VKTPRFTRIALAFRRFARKTNFAGTFLRDQPPTKGVLLNPALTLSLAARLMLLQSLPLLAASPLIRP